MSANIRELFTGISLKKQTNISTLPADADFLFITRVNSAAASVAYNNESDALDFGKGSEWARNLYPAGIDIAVDYEKYLSSEMGAFLIAFSLGSFTVVTEAPGIALYAGGPSDPTTSGNQLPYTACVEGIRVEEAGSFFDRAMAGCVVQSWSMEFTAGPGRGANKCTFQLVGSGLTFAPSGVEFPDTPYAEHPVYLTNVTLDGYDYVLQKRIISLTVAYSNNIRLDQGFVAGGTKWGATVSGGPGYSLRDRLELGDRTLEIKMVVRLEAGSAEYQKLLNQTPCPFFFWTAGTFMEPEGPTYYPHTVNLDVPRTRVSALVIGDENGIVTLEVTLTPLQVGNTPLFNIVSRTNILGIGSPATARDGVQLLPAPEINNSLPPEPPPQP